MSYYVIGVWLFLALVSGIFIGISKSEHEFETSVVVIAVLHCLIAPVFGRILGWW